MVMHVMGIGHMPMHVPLGVMLMPMAVFADGHRVVGDRGRCDRDGNEKGAHAGRAQEVGFGLSS